MKKSVNAYPPCFDSLDKYYLWAIVARQIPPGGSQYCTDCTPDHQARMIEAGRCAYPGTTFRADAKGIVEGSRPIKDRINDRTRAREAA